MIWNVYYRIGLTTVGLSHRDKLFQNWMNTVIIEIRWNLMRKSKNTKPKNNNAIKFLRFINVRVIYPIHETWLIKVFELSFKFNDGNYRLMGICMGNVREFLLWYSKFLLHMELIIENKEINALLIHFIFQTNYLLAHRTLPLTR